MRVLKIMLMKDGKALDQSGKKIEDEENIGNTYTNIDQIKDFEYVLNKKEGNMLIINGLCYNIGKNDPMEIIDKILITINNTTNDIIEYKIERKE